MDVKIDGSWKQVLKEEFEKPYFAKLAAFVRAEYETQRIFPPPALIFNAFSHCSFDRVRVVLLGQDPYHGAGQAHGLCFSVNEGVRQPPSLQNIFKEVQSDIGGTLPTSGNLVRWADQGVLLLNATMTVRENVAGSHQKRGWETFTDAVIEKISAQKEHCVFLLWGNYARQKAVLIDRAKHLVLEAPHPSPLSSYAGFFGCKHFSQANAYLLSHGCEPIRWEP